MKLALVSLNEDRLPRLGLASIATYLEEYLDFKETRIIDNVYEDVYETTVNYRPDVIGVSAMTIEYPRAIEFAEKMRELSVPIILGGVHISMLPRSLKRCFDIGVIGEGEQTFLELVELYQRKGKFLPKDLKKIKGLVFWANGRLVITKERELIEPLDKIPIPDRKYLNKDYYKRRRLFSGVYGVQGLVITSRGCPYRCVFCSTSHFWKKVRLHSVEHVYKEIEELVEDYGVTHVSFWDDLFTIDKERLRKLAKVLKESGISDKIVFNCQSRANLIDDELCEILKSLNIQTVGFGFESGSERVLKYLKRGSVTVEQNKRAIQLCKKHGFRVEGSLMFGSPGETIEDMRETLKFIDLAKANGIDQMWSFVTTPFPGTEVWEIAKKKGVVSDDMDWRLLSHQNVDNPLVLEETVDKEEFRKIFMEGRAKLQVFRWKFLFDYMKSDPVSLLLEGLRHPLSNAKKLLLKTQDYG